MFLSHSHRDKNLARAVARDLRASGAEVWFDEWTMKVGDSITGEVQRGLEDADFVAVLVTRNSIESGWVAKEWQSKIGVEAETRRVVVLPLRGDDCEMPVLLKDRLCADLSTDYDKAIRQVVDVISGVAANASRARTPIAETETDSQVLAPRIRIVVELGREDPQELSFRQSQVIIGRRPECDVVVSEPKVSGEHAEISFRGGMFWLRDLGSKNGTFLVSDGDDDGRRVGTSQVELEHGARVRLATVAELVIDLQDGV